MMETAARQLKVDPAELRRKNFITQFPYQTPVIMAYDAGDFNASLDAAMKAIDYAGFAGAQGESQVGRQAARHRRLLLHRGLRHRAVEGGRQPRRRRRPVGIGGSPRQPGRHHRGPHRLAQPRPGPRDDLLRSWSPSASAFRSARCSIVHGDTDKVQFGMGTYGSRSIAVGGTAIIKAMEKVEAKAKKIAAHALEASENDIVIENGEFKVTGTDKSIALPMVALAAYTAHNLPDGMEPGPEGDRVLRPDQLHLPGRRLYLRARGRCRHRQDLLRQLRRGRRFRPADQPDDRRRPGPWRPRPGHRPGAARRRGLRRQRPAR